MPFPICPMTSENRLSQMVSVPNVVKESMLKEQSKSETPVNPVYVRDAYTDEDTLTRR